MIERKFELIENNFIKCNQQCPLSWYGGFAVRTINKERIKALGLNPEDYPDVTYCMFGENIHEMKKESVQRPDLKQSDKFTPRVCLLHTTALDSSTITPDRA